MTKKEMESVEEIVSELDTAVGKLLVPAMTSPFIKEIMEKLSNISFKLTNML